MARKANLRRIGAKGQGVRKKKRSRVIRPRKGCGRVRLCTARSPNILRPEFTSMSVVLSSALSGLKMPSYFRQVSTRE